MTLPRQSTDCARAMPAVPASWAWDDPWYPLVSIARSCSARCGAAAAPGFGLTAVTLKPFQ